MKRILPFLRTTPTMHAKTGLLAAAIVLVPASLLLWLLLSQGSRPPVAGAKETPPAVSTANEDTPEEPAPARPEPEKPAPPAPPPVFASRQLSALDLSPYLGRRVVVTGPVASLYTTANNERLFWGVPEGLGTASLSDDAQEDRAQVVCVFRGGLPESLQAGASCRVRGTFSKVIATSGVPLLVDCELADADRP